MPNIPSDYCTATTIRRGDTEYLSFGGCNYLGLAHDPRILQAARDAIGRYGLSSSASRETTGNARPHSMLEEQLTEWCGHRAGLLVPDGYTANLAALQGLESMGIKHAVIDQRAHASLKDAAILASMRIHLFDHLNAVHASDILSGLDSSAVVMTDSVFTTDGVLAPASQLNESLRHNDWLLLDDCHGFAVLGDHGRGIADELRLQRDRLIVTTTLAKGLGCAGGIVMGNHDPIEAARNTSIAYRCTTPAAPPLVNAGLEALNILKHDDSIHIHLQRNIIHVREILNSVGIETHTLPTAIFAFTIGDLEQMQSIDAQLLQLGVILPLMEYPNGPAPIYFRLAVNASHTHEQLEHLRSALYKATQTVAVETPKIQS